MPNIIESHSITNYACVHIYNILNEYVYAGMNQDKPKKYKVYTDIDGSRYFNFKGCRVKINSLSVVYKQAI